MIAGTAQGNNQAKTKNKLTADDPKTNLPPDERGLALIKTGRFVAKRESQSSDRR